MFHHRIFLTMQLYIQRHTRRLLWIVVVVPLLGYVLLFRDASPDPFDQPFCNPSDGICHEKPYVASPRTVYSAWKKQQYDQWWKFNDVLNDRARQYAAKRATAIHNPHDNPSSSRRPLILLGDSITESWLGTGMGIPKHRAEGVPEVLQAELSDGGLDPLVLAISGDQTQHLLWRLQNGQMLAEYADDPTSIFVMMIGTNNLGAGELPGPTAQGILTLTEYLLKHTSKQSRILVFHVLPRGDGKTWLPDLCPPRCQIDGTPYTSFLPPIQKVNQAVEEGMKTLRKTYKASETRLEFLDCGQEFLVNNDDQDLDQEVKSSLMPDLLHPNAKGHEILAQCIRRFIDHDL
jgi:lysophospholipase L1-like esterase